MLLVYNIILVITLLKCIGLAHCCRVKQPTDLAECIGVLRQNAGLTIPTTDEEWIDTPRNSIDVRRKHLLTDTLREVKKRRFDDSLLLEVQRSS